MGESDAPKYDFPIQLEGLYMDEPINAACINVLAGFRTKGAVLHRHKAIYSIYICARIPFPGADIRNTSSNALATQYITQTTRHSYTRRG